jgi:hypothetical protein
MRMKKSALNKMSKAQLVSMVMAQSEDIRKLATEKYQQVLDFKRKEDKLNEVISSTNMSAARIKAQADEAKYQLDEELGRVRRELTRERAIVNGLIRTS